MAGFIGRELAAARRLRDKGFDINPALAGTASGFADALSLAELAALNEDARHWVDAAPLALTNWRNGIGMECNAQDLTTAAECWPGEVEALAGSVTPTVALAFQAAHRCEVALELLYDAATDRLCSIVVRGCAGGAFSNLGLRCAASARYAVLPVFHTHPAMTNDRGLRQASWADYQCLRRLQHRLGGTAVGERVYFPDGSCTEYGLSASGLLFDQPCGSGFCTLWADTLLD